MLSGPTALLGLGFESISYTLVGSTVMVFSYSVGVGRSPPAGKTKSLLVKVELRVKNLRSCDWVIVN